jgi:putative tryptophan/tyrosine transport system substrate-binding protein
VEQGIVEGLARPGRNATGFFVTEPSAGGKWLELLKELVPGLRRVAVIFNPDSAPAGKSYLHSIENAAASFSVGAIGNPVHDTADIDHALNSLAHESGGGLIVLPDDFTASHRKQIIELAARYRLPAIGATRDFADDGGLLTRAVRAAWRHPPATTPLPSTATSEYLFRRPGAYACPAAPAPCQRPDRRRHSR